MVRLFLLAERHLLVLKEIARHILQFGRRRPLSPPPIWIHILGTTRFGHLHCLHERRRNRLVCGVGRHRLPGTGRESGSEDLRIPQATFVVLRFLGGDALLVRFPVIFRACVSNISTAL
jgi:hypothetical protein